MADTVTRRTAGAVTDRSARRPVWFLQDTSFLADAYGFGGAFVASVAVSVLVSGIVALGSAMPSPAFADPVPLTTVVEIGRPPVSVSVRVEAGDAVTLTATAGRRTARETMPVRSVADATVVAVEASGTTVAVVRGTSEDSGAFAAVIGVRAGRPHIVWNGRTDLHGDVGERSADVLSLTDRTGDGQADVVVGVRREGAGICGRPETIVQARGLDPRTGTMRPVVLSRVDANAAVAVTATRESPGPSGAPILRALQFRGASSRSGAGETHDALGPPRALTDGRSETFWAEGRGGSGRGEFVSGRWATRLPIRAFALTIAPTGDAAASLGRPRTLFLVGDEGAALRVVIPEDALQHPGARYWVRPPEPLSWGCLALVLDEAFAPTGVREAGVHTGLAEVEVYTGLDFGEGLDGLVSMLVMGGRSGDEAARLLTTVEGDVVTPTLAAWERLDEQGRRRAVRVLAHAARRGSGDVPARATDGLGVAARDDGEEVRQSALQALGTLGPRAGEILIGLARDNGAAADDAVTSLVRHEPSIALPGLLSAIAAEGGASRPVVREGLAQVVARSDAETAARFDAWVATGPPTSALASAVLGLADHRPTRTRAPALLARVIEEAETFEDRWRAVRAARRTPAESSLDAWLASLVGEAEEWMLRSAALEALGERAAPERLAIARAALEDNYPRVRVAAIAVLDETNDDGVDEILAQLITADSWPMVRQAAVDALWDRPSATRAVRRAIRDRSPRVRTAALRAVTRSGDETAWSNVRARLEDAEEWPQVSIAALGYVRSRCLEAAGPAVLGVLERGLRPNAWAPDVDVAAFAMDLAMRLGGETAERANQLARRSSTPASVLAAYERRERAPEACNAAVR